MNNHSNNSVKPTNERLISYMTAILQLDPSDYIQVHRSIIAFLLDDLKLQKEVDDILERSVANVKRRKEE